MDFAPYQSSPPEHSRVASPDRGFGIASPRVSSDLRRPFSPATSPPPIQHPQPQRGWSGFDGQTSTWNAAASSSPFAGPPSSSMPGSYPVAEVSEFDTSLGLRLDYEACLAYLAFPPLGAIILLVLERNSDYVRFHSWQSALLFTTLMLFHLFLSWSIFLSWLFFIADLILIALLTLRAYKDAEILDRFEVPFFGKIASRILDDE
ncbi:hypothetical protein S7711_08996 [Stachybotrys chartarum IBT 7711]|uniref:Uncharacterized protein n=1 Tax=Stachybotrys chartarum (strain CBS 109288 / IBT 7711) TaxID=1280523 RepID=A0A084AX26_STACB|nr:hypothetical protein S7711_08996 [Stachybotrys chartarum IBT 7711]KFA47655.1 hypothetical protein S40293_07678 [Stachybotrys chartarum IBT 40293]KFA75070.1 hypothetical protein S40288_06591 [Stachybotrys chartarum IBT 40288]